MFKKTNTIVSALNITLTNEEVLMKPITTDQDIDDMEAMWNRSGPIWIEEDMWDGYEFPAEEPYLTKEEYEALLSEELE